MRNCHNSSSYFDVVEKEIIGALRTWLKGYKVKINTIGYADDIKDAEKKVNKLHQEQEKLNAQMDNAYTLVEQGVYTLDVFKSRRAKLMSAKEELDIKVADLESLIARMEESQSSQANLIPQTEELLASYDDMTNQERNLLLKEILEKIEYYKGSDGQVIIDLYPRLPRI